MFSDKEFEDLLKDRGRNIQFFNVLFADKDQLFYILINEEIFVLKPMDIMAFIGILNDVWGKVSMQKHQEAMNEFVFGEFPKPTMKRIAKRDSKKAIECWEKMIQEDRDKKLGGPKNNKDAD